jgi:hypothetical protein
MSFEPAILAQAARALAGADFTEENRQIGVIEAEIAEIEAAADLARDRIADIGRTLVASHQPDAQAVADALLANAEPRDAAAASPSSDELENERAALRAALMELQQRKQKKEAEITALRNGARESFRPVVQPVVEVVFEEAKAAGERIFECYAALFAVEVATGAKFEQTRILRRAIDGLSKDYNLCQRRPEAKVPVQVIDALADLPIGELPFRASLVDVVRVL